MEFIRKDQIKNITPGLREEKKKNTHCSQIFIYYCLISEAGIFWAVS